MSTAIRILVTILYRLVWAVITIAAAKAVENPLLIHPSATVFNVLPNHVRPAVTVAMIPETPRDIVIQQPQLLELRLAAPFRVLWIHGEKATRHWSTKTKQGNRLLVMKQITRFLHICFDYFQGRGVDHTPALLEMHSLHRQVKKSLNAHCKKKNKMFHPVLFLPAHACICLNCASCTTMWQYIWGRRRGCSGAQGICTPKIILVVRECVRVFACVP